MDGGLKYCINVKFVEVDNYIVIVREYYNFQVVYIEILGIRGINVYNLVLDG